MTYCKGKTKDMTHHPLHAIVDYEDPYVQPLIIDALTSQLGPACTIHTSINTLPKTTHHHNLLQIRSYETLDFEHALASSSSSNPTSLINAYIIRKALIRKHYLSNLIHHYTAKNGTSHLLTHFKPAEDFELDYAEFLDEALVECFELRASLERNRERREGRDMEWWILKPGMSDRGQGIRLFCGEEELTEIFEEWDGEESGDEVEEEEVVESEGEINGDGEIVGDGANAADRDYIVTSHLRHFVVQPYIHPPLPVSYTHLTLPTKRIV